MGMVVYVVVLLLVTQITKVECESEYFCPSYRDKWHLLKGEGGGVALVVPSGSSPSLQRLSIELVRALMIERLGYKVDSPREWPDEPTRLCRKPIDRLLQHTADRFGERWLWVDLCVDEDETSRARADALSKRVLRLGEAIDRLPKDWYLTPPNALDEEDYRSFSAITLRQLGEETVAAKLAVDNDTLDLIRRQRLSQRFYCEDEQNKCEDRDYTPTICQGGGKCALLLASDPRDSEFLIKDIRRWALRVRVLFLGPNLWRSVRELASRPSPTPFLFFDRPPQDTPLASLPQLRLRRPPCGLGERCEYRSPVCVKYATEGVRRHPALHSLLLNFHLATEETSALLAVYEKETSKKADPEGYEREAAERFLRESPSTPERWLRPRSPPALVLRTLMPLSGTTSYGAAQLIASLSLAQSVLLDSRSALLRGGSQIAIVPVDGRCSADGALTALVSESRETTSWNSLAGLTGPACGIAFEVAASLSMAMRMPLIAYTPESDRPSTEGASLEERKYGEWGSGLARSLVVLAAGSYDNLAPGIVALFERLGWKRLAVLVEGGPLRAGLVARLSSDSRLRLVLETDTSALNDPRKWVSDLKRARVRVLLVQVEEASFVRSAVCAAIEGRITIQYLLPRHLPNYWTNTTHYNLYGSESNACTQEQIEEAIEGHLSVAHRWLTDTEGGPRGGLTLSEWKERYTRRCLHFSEYPETLPEISPLTVPSSSGRECWPPPPSATLLYDVLWLQVNALRALTDHQSGDRPLDTRNLHTARQFVENIVNLNHSGISGDFDFRGGRTRITTLDIYQWTNRTHRKVGEFLAGRVVGAEVIDGRLRLHEKLLSWNTEDGRPPDDGGEECILRPLALWLGTDCSGALVALNIFAFAFLALTLVAVLVCYKRRFERRCREKMLSHGEDSLGPTKISSLDKWELSRERVVINRKLGVGAFGTVYGGHAVLGEDVTWTAVAVKSLKPGTGTEEKLDFLSEAEAMKRFDHENVVKLLAVVTRSEPVCIVMELMLYGDLRGYLLARRHLAGGGRSTADGAENEREEVSPRMLTSMALDVARALSYLTHLTYVHRDVASRNCLVGARRRVKLADFGMTRLVFENDYYRFSRKGMLPVRWMAPESLALGVFSQASDIWSFGVLLYEIVTFGALPFQGLTNGEVLARVKAGETIALPSGMKPQLEGLIKSCWNRDYKKRPHASEVAEFLADSPRLLTACLDVPLDSLPLEECFEWKSPKTPQFLHKNGLSNSHDTEVMRRRGDFRPQRHSPSPPPLYAATASDITETTEISDADGAEEESEGEEKLFLS